MFQSKRKKTKVAAEKKSHHKVLWYHVKLETPNWIIQWTDTHTYIATAKCYSRKEVVVMLELRLSRIWWDCNNYATYNFLNYGDFIL
jgi:hypothetical protein